MKILRRIVGLISSVILIGMIMGALITLPKSYSGLKVTLWYIGNYCTLIAPLMTSIFLVYLVFWGLIKSTKAKLAVKILRKIIGVVSLGSIIILWLAIFVPGLDLMNLAVLILFAVPLYLVYWGFKK